MAATQTETLRLVHKTKYDVQSFHDIPKLQTSLQPSKIRVRTSLVGLTSTNLSYCAAGSILHWWDAYPLPSTTPASHNDSEQYGISPGWGYATVLDSTIPNIRPGRVVFGLLPISAHTFDLQLNASEECPGHYIETSPHRHRVMNLYQRYVLQPETFHLNDAMLGPSSTALWRAVLLVWEAGYFLAKYTFAQENDPVHPSGPPIPGFPPLMPWTPDQANLTSTALICVASSTKTCRTFLHTIAKLHPPKSDFTIIEITSSSTGCKSYLPSLPFNHQLLSYPEATNQSSYPKYDKYVVLDFGGRDNVAPRIVDTLRSLHADAQITFMAIGSEPKMGGGSDQGVSVAVQNNAAWYQMNTTGIKDIVLEREGERRVFEELDRAFVEMVKVQTEEYGDTVLGVKLRVETGLKGDAGVEGLWARLCEGAIAGDDGIVVRLDA